MGGKTAIQEYFELFDFSEKCAMEHLSVIFEKGSSKVSSKKTYNEYQNFAPVDGFDIQSVTLKRLVNDARCRIIHTRPKITSWKKLSGLSNSLVGVRRNGGMAEKLPPNPRRWNGGRLSEIPQMKQRKITRNPK